MNNDGKEDNMMSNLNSSKYILSDKRRDHDGIMVVIPNRTYSDNLLLNTMKPLALLLNKVCAAQA